MSWSRDDIPDLSGRTAVITGANGGLGLASAAALAAKGAHVVMAARNQEKAAAARESILTSTPKASLSVVPLDLGSLASVEQAAQEILSRHDRIEILMNNAGVMAMPEGKTIDGFETQFGTNHLGHWALTSHLLPTLLRTKGARIVTVTSTAQHTGRRVNPKDPNLTKRYDAWLAYGQSKLANRHFAMGLQDQFEEAGVDTIALTAHPGLTNSDLQATTVHQGGGGFLGRFFHGLTTSIGMDVPRGALSQLRAATDPKAKGGTMYGPLLAAIGPPTVRPLVRPGSGKSIKILWAVSEELTGLPVDVQKALSST